MIKRVIRSPLDLLELHQKQALLAWLTTGGPHGVGISYKAARDRLAREFGIKTSPSSLHGFLRRSRGVREHLVEQTYDAVSRKLTIVVHFPNEIRK